MSCKVTAFAGGFLKNIAVASLASLRDQLHQEIFFESSQASQAFDSSGNSSSSAPVTLTVNMDTVAPTVTITAATRISARVTPRSFAIMRSFGQPVVFDVTHSVQSPGGEGDRSGGHSEYVPYLARAGAAAGVNAFFFEVHDRPEKALSDGPNALRLEKFPALVADLLRIREALGRRS